MHCLDQFYKCPLMCFSECAQNLVSGPGFVALHVLFQTLHTAIGLSCSLHSQLQYTPALWHARSFNQHLPTIEPFKEPMCLDAIR